MATEITPVPAVAPVDKATVGWVVTFTPVRAVTSSLLFAEVVAEVIPVATEMTPVPAVAPVAKAIVGWDDTETPVMAVTSSLLLAEVEALVIPVATDAPLALASREPVATVIAVPRVGAVELPPEMINVSASSPVPIAKLQVEAEPAAVTLGTVVVTILLVEGVTVVVKVASDPRHLSVLLALTAVPLAVAEILVVVGVTVVVKVASDPRHLSVPSAPTAVPLAVALILVVVGETVVVNEVPVPSTSSVV